MNGSIRQSMLWLHTWSGLLVGWVLYAVFLTGAAAYFNDEITQWMRPEIAAPTSPRASLANAVAFLEAKAPGARSWTITLPSDRNPVAAVSWRPEPKPGEAQQQRGRNNANQATLDAAGEPIAVRETRGGTFLYRFHFDLHYMPVIWARWIVGFCAMFMLVAIVSGVITHKKIFTDFFTLRLRKGQRSWLDSHAVSAVLALPFHTMITYTGLVTLMSLYMPWGVMATYEDQAAFVRDAFPPTAAIARANAPASLGDLDAMLDKAAARFGGHRPDSLTITLPGDAAARVEIASPESSRLNARADSLTFDAVSGALLAASPERGAASATQGVMIGLHAGRFADVALRWLYFLAGVAGTAMVATGLVLWTVKRRARLPDPERPHLGFRLVERLNIGSIVGLMGGVACYFLANRLLPVGLAGRAQWEIDALFIGWGALFAWTLVRPAKRAWIETLAMAALLYLAIPVVNVATTERGLLASLLSGDWVYAGFDLTMIATAAILGWASFKTLRHQPRKKPERARRPASGAAPAAGEEAMA